MVYCVVRFGEGQRDGILCGECLGKFSVMVYCVVRFGKGQRNGIFCGEGWARVA
jgi:flagellar biosynthesis/type III secretory pathway ATPase